MMGEISGFQLASVIKSSPATALIPIIFCTALDGENDEVHGLDLGADDYISKPYSVRTLIARVRSVLRRNTAENTVDGDDEALTYKGLCVLPNRKMCMVDGLEVKMPRKEFEILAVLMHHPGHIFFERRPSRAHMARGSHCARSCGRRQYHTHSAENRPLWPQYCHTFKATVMSLWSKVSYPSRLFLWLLCYSLLMVGGFVAYQYGREKEFKAEELNLRLQLVNERILTDLGDGIDIGTIVRGSDSPSGKLRVSLIDRNGRMVYDNFTGNPDSADHSRRSEVIGARARGNAYTVRRHSASTGDTYFYSATCGDDGMIVRTAVPYDVSLLELLEADYGFLRIMGLMTVLMCVLGFFATRRIGSHISRLSDFCL